MALHSALKEGPHLDALQALLECGADPSTDDFRIFASAARWPARLPALHLLLHHCPASRRAQAVKRAFDAAVYSVCLEAMHLLMPECPGAAVERQVPSAAAAGTPGVLQMLLSHHPVTSPLLDHSLVLAATCGHATCAAVLLDQGADVHTEHELPLRSAVRARDGPPARAHWPAPDPFATVVLLVGRGAVVTAEVLDAVEERAAAEELAAAGVVVGHQVA